MRSLGSLREFTCVTDIHDGNFEGSGRSNCPHFHCEFIMFHSLCGWFRQPVRRRSRTHAGHCLEALESRELLAADAALTAIVLNSVDSDSLSYTVTIGNVGDAAMNANDVTLQGYLSEDDVLDGGDIPASGYGVDINLLANLALLTTKSSTYTLENYNSHAYLIVTLDPSNNLGQNTANNTIAIALPPLPGVTVENTVTVGKVGKTIIVDPAISYFGSSNADGSVITVDVVGNSPELDVLSLKKRKTDDGVLKRKGDTLKLGKNVIGTITGGTEGEDLVITLTAEGVNAKRMQEIMSSVTLKGAKKTPGLRAVGFQITQPTQVEGVRTPKGISLN